jgi:hypothetical protein
VVCQSFDDFMAAFGLAVTYDAVYISWWMADYVRHGFTARSLGSRMGSCAGSQASARRNSRRWTASRGNG